MATGRDRTSQRSQWIAGRRRGILCRMSDAREPAPERTTPECVALTAALARLAAGAPYRTALEGLLLGLAPEDADAWMMLLKESRGAFALLCPSAAAPRGAEAPARRSRALCIGDARSGTGVALATLGHHVTLFDQDAARLRFALARGEAYVPGRTTAVLAGSDATLPFADSAFDMVVQEGGLPGPRGRFAHSTAELRRVARSTLVVCADNRFGYKRSTGRRGRFDRDPRMLLAEALAPSRGERGLFGTRRATRGDWPEARAFALYPHALEFSHVVALDRPTPRLTVRRRERRNLVKVIGQRLGLFPLLTPSFAIIAREARGPRCVDRMLDALAATIGEPRPEADVLIATRSNDAIVQTALPGHGEDEPAGRWTVHVPLQPGKERMVRTHHAWLVELHAAGVPVPEPLFSGPLEGVTVSVERRLPGITGADITGNRAATVRMFTETIDVFSRLVSPEDAPLDGARFDALIGARADIALRYVPRAETRAALSRLVDEARERMVGRALPRAVYHADLRAKHLAVRADGALLGVLDWGASERDFVAYVDVLHLVLHQRKQEEGGSFGEAWALAREPQRLRAHERAALDRYCDAVRLDPSVRQCIESLYPVFIAGMAERNWDYSRPDWVHRQFGL